MRLVDIVPPQILGRGAPKTQTEMEANYADHYRSHQENGVDTGSLTVDGLPVFLERKERLSVILLLRIKIGKRGMEEEIGNSVGMML